MASLSLCMIAKNEEIDLDICLRSVKNSVDQIIIVDTGSNDDTKKVALGYGATVLDYNQETDPEGFLFDDEKLSPAPHSHTWFLADFAAARNLSFKHATGDFILWLDSDDLVVGEKNLRAVIEVLKEKNLDGAWVEYQYGWRGEKCIGKIWRDRIVRNGFAQWKSPIHETLCPVPRENNGIFVEASKFLVKQRPRSGHAAESRVPHRNLKVLLHEWEKNKDTPEKRDIRHLSYIGNECFGIDPEKSIWAYNEYIKLAVWEEEKVMARYFLGAIYELRRDYHQAFKEYAAAVAESPLPEAWFALARLAYFKNDWARCVSFTETGFHIGSAERILQRNPQDLSFRPHLYYNKALYHIGRVEDALRSCNAGLAVEENQWLKINKKIYEQELRTRTVAA